MNTISIQLLLPLIAAVVLLGISVAVVASMIAQQRVKQKFLQRAVLPANDETALALRDDEVDAGGSSLQRLLARFVKRDEQETVEIDESLSAKLVRAGYDDESAAAVFGLLRVAILAAVVLLALLVVPKTDVRQFALGLVVAVAVGWLLPPAVLDRLAARRQSVIRVAIPDMLDLLIVCLEAGVALDAGLQRVSRELYTTHPVLASELRIMMRRVNAGEARDAAMHGLFNRTGVDELRSLASSMIQSEKWGTSIVQVLRVYSEQLRRKRQSDAEKRAATASTRMMFPMLLLIFPPIFVILLGGAIMRIRENFS